MESTARSRMQTERMKALTDGVLAIVLTILVLGFEVPEHDFGHDGLLKFLAKLAQPFVAYVVTFGIVSTYWFQHTSIYHYVAVGNRPFFWINLCFLLPVSMLPFLTNLRAVYHDEHVITVLYATVNVICGLLLYAMWSYGARHELLRPLSPAVDTSMRRRILLGVGLNVLGAGAAWINTQLSSLFFIAMPLLYLSHRVVDSRWNYPAGRAGG